MKARRKSLKQKKAIAVFVLMAGFIAGCVLPNMSVVHADPGLTIAGVYNPDPIVVAYGTPIENVPLPATMTVILSDNSETDLPATWSNTSLYSPTGIGMHVIIGFLTLMDNSTSSATAYVIVSAPLNITSVATQADISVANGTAIGLVGLPTMVGIGLSNGSNASTAVAWNGGTPIYDGNTSGTYAFLGTLTVPSNNTNTGNLTAAVNVIVAAPVTPTSTPSSTPTLSADATLSSLTVNGTLVAGFNPATLNYNVTLSAGTTVVPTVIAIANEIHAVAVVTDAIALPGTSTVLVTAENGTSTKTYSIAFTVAPAPIVPASTSTVLNITSVSAQSDINVVNGTAINLVGLPTTVGVGLSDGSTSSVAVAWNGGTPAYNSTTAGTYGFIGTLTISSSTTNTANLTAAVNVLVAAPVIATSTSTSTPEDNGPTVGGSVGVSAGYVVAPGLSIGTGAVTTGDVLGASTTCGVYLENYLARGMKNDAGDVKKLQSFLNQDLSLTIPMTGYFGSTTFSGVKQFQTKYASDILDPWTALDPAHPMTANGNVYKLTLWKINDLVCPTLGLDVPMIP